ncbi:sensor histidine kinase [Dactylosporangium siamense]|uniref:histidine kinase n=1 Tax=Dactylosporangium siamense TaxID=685454 RepID=A0A919PM83_9ACTN|nr:ATP-binding protein [Dactylosporangium siamense]GIG47370.1 two-component sensor histidine kinase [Dactylosporangium siamense]
MNLKLLLVVLPVGLLGLCALPLTGPAGIIPGAAAVAAVAVAALQRAPWPAALVAGGSLLADALYTGPPQPPALWAPVEFTALTVLLVSLARRGPARATVAVGLAVTALPLRMSLHVPGDRVEASVLLAAAAFTAAVGAAGSGLYLRLGDHRRRLAEEQARRAHRLDLARDLHDLVAHEVTGIVIAAQAAALPDIEAAGLRALDAMDRMVSTLRGPVSQRVHGVVDLPDVVRRFSATGPAAATLTMSELPGLSDEASKAAYHVVIEALTNVRRHAPAATTVTVTVTSTGPGVELRIVNDRSAEPRPERDGGGTGLAGLDERVRSLGGDLTAGPLGDGWQVICHLPAAG